MHGKFVTGVKRGGPIEVINERGMRIDENVGNIVTSRKHD